MAAVKRHIDDYARNKCMKMLANLVNLFTVAVATCNWMPQTKVRNWITVVYSMFRAGKRHNSYYLSHTFSIQIISHTIIHSSLFTNTKKLDLAFSFHLVKWGTCEAYQVEPWKCLNMCKLGFTMSVPKVIHGLPPKVQILIQKY